MENSKSFKNLFHCTFSIILGILLIVGAYVGWFIIIVFQIVMILLKLIWFFIDLIVNDIPNKIKSINIYTDRRIRQQRELKNIKTIYKSTIKFYKEYYKLRNSKNKKSEDQKHLLRYYEKIVSNDINQFYEMHGDFFIFNTNIRKRDYKKLNKMTNNIEKVKRKEKV